jgi:hypothetical protein
MGMFDDLIPASSQRSGGMFDDLIPAGPSASAAPSVPTYVEGADGREVALNSDQLADMQARQKQAREAEQAEFDKTRTPGARVRGATRFATSVIPRMLTQGQVGAGDIVGFINPDAGAAINQSEADFVRANRGQSVLQTGNPLDIASLATLQHVGEIGAGIPVLQSMGAVPGQTLRSGAAAARNLPSSIRRLVTEDVGSGPIPGGGTAPTPPAPPSMPLNSLVQPGRLPNRQETFAAADRLKTDLGAQVDIPEMVAGGNWKQTVAAGLRSVPFAGDPIEGAFQKGLRQLEAAKGAITSGAQIGQEAAGEGIRSGALGWMTKHSKDYTKGFYDKVYDAIDQTATRPLTKTAQLVEEFRREMQRSTGTAPVAAIKKVEDALARPEGLSVKGISELRSEIGDLVDEATVAKSPSQRAFSRLYGAITEDLRSTVGQAGGPQALRAWETANREARIVAGKRGRLARIVGTTDEKLSAESVFKKAEAAAREGGNARELRLLKDVVGEKEWVNFGAELVNRLGVDSKTGLFSGDRFLTAYGKFSPAGKDLVFGVAKTHLDDIATIAKKYGELSAKFNRSNTGIVNGVLKILANPAGAAVNIGTAAINPMAAITVGGQLGGLATGRSVAWALAKPSSLKQASGVLRAYYNVERARAVGRVVAAREQELASSIRTFSMTVARDTGQSAESIEKALREQMNPKPAP